MNTDLDIDDLLDLPIGTVDTTISPDDLSDPRPLMQAVAQELCGDLIDNANRAAVALQTAIDADTDNWDYANNLALATNDYTNAILPLNAQMTKAAWAMAHTAFA